MTAADLEKAADLIAGVAEAAWDVECALEDDELSRAEIKRLARRLSTDGRDRLNDALATLNSAIEAAREEMIARDLASLAAKTPCNRMSA